MGRVLALGGGTKITRKKVHDFAKSLLCGAAKFAEKERKKNQILTWGKPGSPKKSLAGIPPQNFFCKTEKKKEKTRLRIFFAQQKFDKPRFPNPPGPRMAFTERGPKASICILPPPRPGTTHVQIYKKY